MVAEPWWCTRESDVAGAESTSHAPPAGTFSLSDTHLMGTAELIVAVLAGGLVAAAVIAVFVASLRGRDIAVFESYRTTSPEHYRNLVWVCRINGPMVALMCIVVMAATPFIARDPGGGILLASSTFAGSGIFLWLSLRWFAWSLHA